jgi:putative hydrolase of the HAD superfamily
MECILKYQAVIFDLFGTLIPSFSVSEYQKRLLQMAEVLNAPPGEFCELWVALFQEGVLGVFSTTEAQIEYACKKLGVSATDLAIKQSARIMQDYEAATMLPRSEAVEVLRGLKNQNLKIGLITDCSADAPSEWSRTPLAVWFDATVFSCLVGMRKPDPRIYQLALGKLGVKAQDSLYIGDGSSQELSGATAVGMTAVMLKIPGEQNSDVYRIGLEDWKGKSIASLQEVWQLLTG